MARKGTGRDRVVTPAESTPEARLDAKLKAMFASIARSRVPVVLTDLDSLPGARRTDRRN